MDFADYSAVRYDLYSDMDAALENEPFATISNDEFGTLGLVVAWGDVHPEDGEISQGGAVRK
jgi:hypothetical protein